MQAFYLDHCRIWNWWFGCKFRISLRWSTWSDSLGNWGKCLGGLEICNDRWIDRECRGSGWVRSVRRRFCGLWNGVVLVFLQGTSFGWELGAVLVGGLPFLKTVLYWTDLSRVLKLAFMILKMVRLCWIILIAALLIICLQEVALIFIFILFIWFLFVFLPLFSY